MAREIQLGRLFLYFEWQSRFLRRWRFSWRTNVYLFRGEKVVFSLIIAPIRIDARWVYDSDNWTAGSLVFPEHQIKLFGKNPP